MDKVIKLVAYRTKRQKAWLHKNQRRFFHFLYDFISHHMGMNFLEAFASYQSLQRRNHQEAWDYTDLRELLYEGMDGPFSELLYGELSKEWWFDRKLVSKDEALEHCLSLYIMDSLHNLSAPHGSS